MKLKELTIPIAFIISAFIIGGFLYAIQINKQNSIEKQTQMKIDADRDVELGKLRLQEEKQLQEDRNDEFVNELKCQELLSDLKKRWNNVVGVSYSSSWNTCMVKYTDDDGETQSSPVEDMQDK